MARPEKEQKVEEIVAKLTSASGVYLANYQGLSVAEISDLRSKLRESNVELTVVKNTLARISLERVGLSELGKYLTGPTAMAFCLADPIQGAKILFDYQKQNEKLGLKACVFDNHVYDRSYIEAIAKLPPPEQIKAQVIGMLAAPLRSTVNVLYSLLSSLVAVLSEIQKQREAKADS